MPLYQQLKKIIEKKVNSQELKPHDKIPSERELCEKHNLSRTTVRQAIGGAINEGLLYRIHGKGTFVANPHINQGLVNLVGFEETLLRRGLKPSIQILNIEYVPGNVEISTLLGLESNTEIVEVKVLGLADDKPMAVFNYFLPVSYGKSAVEKLKEVANKGNWFSFTRYYKNTLQLNLGLAKQTFEAQIAEKSLCELLEIPEGHPVFHVTSIIYTTDNLPVELRKVYYRGDRYKFNINREIITN